jgi:hypothetical protein
MKTILSLAFFCFALSFCNLVDRLTGKTGNTTTSNTSANTSSNTGSTSSPDAGSEPVEKYSLTPAQTAILNGGKEMQWDDQGIGWVLPPSWKKVSSNPISLQWSSNDGAFLIVSISPLSDDFPMEASYQAEYKGAETRQKNGELEKFRYVEIDGVKGVEFIETMPYDKEGPRRHQWIALRKYAGRTQQINIMLSTKGSNFEKHRDEFAAIMASTKITR